MPDLHTQLADLIAELVNPQTIPTNYTLDNGEKRVHRATHPSLIDQLAAAIEPGGTAEDGHRIPASKPAARLDAIDRLTAIEAACGSWLANTDNYRLSHGIHHNLRRLVGVMWVGDDLDDLVRAARRWVIWARTVTGWETPPFRPHVRCPVCDWLGGLRIRLADKAACCVECGAVWDSSNIGILGDYIRDTNTERERHDTGELPSIGVLA